MGFKDLFNQAKQKVKETIDKGNSEIKKSAATIKMSIYSKPALGGFGSARVFKGEDGLEMAVEDFKKDELALKTIFKLEDDENIYVVTEIESEEHIKELVVEDKTFTYPCYTVKYRPLNDVFTEETMSMPYQELTEVQHDLLEKMKKEIDGRPLVATEKKEAIEQLWQYFTECISYQLKDYFLTDTFVKIADDYVTDFSSYLLKLFA